MTFFLHSFSFAFDFWMNFVKISVKICILANGWMYAMSSLPNFCSACAVSLIYFICYGVYCDMYNECFDIWTASCCSCCVDAALWCAGHGLLNTNIFFILFWCNNFFCHLWSASRCTQARIRHYTSKHLLLLKNDTNKRE